MSSNIQQGCKKSVMVFLEKPEQVSKTDLTEKQVYLISELNCLCLDFSHELEGFDDDIHTEQILDLVLASHGWEWEEFYDKFIR